MAMFVKLSGEVPTTQKTLFRNAVSMVIAFGFVIYFKAPIFGKKKNQKYLLLRSALGAVGNLLNFYAIDQVVLSDADMLNKMNVFLKLFFATVFLKEDVRRFQTDAIVIAFEGSFFIK